MTALTGGSLALASTRALARRAALGTFRQPQVWLPPLFFPLFFVALNTAALGRSTSLPQFPADSMLDFLLPTALMQGVLFGGMAGGAELAVDIESGFFDRLVASPVPRLSILLGRLGGAALLGLVQAGFFAGVLTIFGARVEAGLAGYAVLLLLGVVLAVAVGGMAMAMALRTGSSEAVQGAFPLFFVLMFVSSAFFPRQLMNGWYQDVANLNPISYLIEGARRLVTDGFSFTDAGQALGVAGALAGLTLLFAVRSLRRRVRVAA